MKTTAMLMALLCVCAFAQSDLPAAATPAVTAQTDAITIPQLLSYQGKLTDNSGNPVPDTTYSVLFRLYTQASGGTAFWTETQTVRTRNGLFSTLLGSVTPVGSMPDGGSVYLGMAVSGGAELTPRLRIASAAYAYLSGRAAGADLLQGKDTTGFVRSAQANSITSAMIVDATIGAADLNQMGAASGQVLKWTGSAWAPRNDSIGGGGANTWVRATPSDSVLYTVNRLGIVRGGAGNVLYGLDSTKSSFVNLGIACTTGVSGQNNPYAAVNGGLGNKASARWATVSGGWNNRATGERATIGGGSTNTSSNSASTVVGGQVNTASGALSVVGGGSENTASGSSSFVGGGAQNRAWGSYSAVGCGIDNEALAHKAVVPGGERNIVRGTHSLAAGYYARANHRGSFVWSDSAMTEAETVYTTNANQFRVRARGGTWFYSNGNQTTGVTLASNSNAWASTCDSLNKEDFRAVDRQEVLQKLAALRVRNYKMRDQDDGTRHIGPVAQDFAAAFGVGENNTTINMADADGVLFAAVQALYEQNRELSDQNRQMMAEIEALKASIERR